jgi:hypothetical protein
MLIRCPPLGKHSPHQKSLHPSRRMAWKKLRHGVAVNFLTPRKKTRQSLTNKYVPVKFYKISKNNWFRNRAIGKRWGVRENASMPTG